MKTYWNRKETESVLGAFAAMECLREFKEGWGERGELTEEEAEKFGEAWERVNEGLTLMCERVDRGTQEKVLRSSSQYRVMLAPVEGRSFAVEAEKELGGECAYVTVEALSKLAELALEACCGPCICKGNQGACRARGAFIDLEIPFFNENPPAGTCPYEIEKEYWQDEKEARLKVVERIPTERLVELAAMEKKKQERAEIDLTDKCGSCKHFESTKGSKGICREKEKETARSRRKCQGYINGSLPL